MLIQRVVTKNDIKEARARLAELLSHTCLTIAQRRAIHLARAMLKQKS